MYPAQTSLIPATVALTEFIGENGFSGLYPYWYLGTTPVKYLTGPVVPIISNLLNELFGVGLFEISIWLVFFSIIFSAIGWGIFVGNISGNKKTGLMVFCISLFLPWHWFSSLGLSEVSAVFSLSISGWLLYFYRKYILSNFQIIKAAGVVSIITIILLINSTAALSSIMSLIVLAIFLEKNLATSLKRVLVIVWVGWMLSSAWYGFGYWLTIFGSPSIGGKSLWGVVVSLIDSMRSFVPVILAVVLVWWQVKSKSLLSKFILYYFVLFGSMTLFRFLSDWDFWMDWSVWLWQIEVGLALVIGLWVRRLVGKWDGRYIGTLVRGLVGRLGNSNKLLINKLSVIFLLITVYFIGGWYIVLNKTDLWLPRYSIDDSVELRIANELSRITNENDRVLLSGSTAFWLNSLSEVKQVRGGRDEVSVNSEWRDVVWSIRNGIDIDRSIEYLKDNKVNYLVVHGDESQEYYHDYSNIQRFESHNRLEVVYSYGGDIIYRIK